MGPKAGAQRHGLSGWIPAFAGKQMEVEIG